MSYNRHDHICGIYYVLGTAQYQSTRYYLPQAELSSHTHITRLYQTTKLRQLFSNSSKETIKELRYTFPLYDGVSVGAYTITYGDVTLTGVVKQKAEAKQTYDAAVERGETASLLESLPAGVFAVSIGNLPANTDVQVEITYAGDLKHDAGIDGLRYTLPTSIAPRYGSYPGEVVNSTVGAKGISITVDVDTGMSNIRKIQSPTHPIAVSMGSLTNGSATEEFKPSHASATLTQGTTELGGDFVLQLVIDALDTPQAVLETHPALDSRAIMATLVPKFDLPQAAPEIVFIADQSGSMMGGSKNTELIAAMEVFLKSLPFGVRFNICAFGSDYRYLWSKSQAYSESNLKVALKWVEKFNASYGGTEMFEPVKQAFLRRHTDLPLEIVLLTDGEIWGEDQLFDLINTKIRTEKIDARVFTLGIGADVSHTLVEGVARAGNGFAQFITNNEETDKKVIRSLKACLFPHLSDYSLEVNFAEDQAMVDDGFEIVEKITNQLQIDDPPAYNKSKSVQNTTPISFFDESASKDAIIEKTDNADRYAHLPKVQLPKILQAPASVPPLHRFNRSTVYLMLGPDAPKKNVASVTLRAKGPFGPLELTVPVYTQPERGTSLHQLAARKAIQDLEEGRGWLHEATTTDGYSVKQKHSSRFEELVEQEAVRLGTTFGVAGKWTSFVAVSNDASDDATAEKIAHPGMEQQRDRAVPSGAIASGRSHRKRRMATPSMMPQAYQMGAATSSAKPMARSSFGGARATGAASGGLFGGSSGLFSRGASLFGSNHAPPGIACCAVPPPPPAMAAPASAAASQFGSVSVGFGKAPDLSPQRMVAQHMEPYVSQEDSEDVDAASTFQSGIGFMEKKSSPANDLRAIIKLQKFDGRWIWDDTLANAVRLRGVSNGTWPSKQGSVGKIDDQTATIYVLAFLEKYMPDREVWALIADKARAYLANNFKIDVDAAVKEAQEKQIL